MNAHPDPINPDLPGTPFVHTGKQFSRGARFAGRRAIGPLAASAGGLVGFFFCLLPGEDAPGIWLAVAAVITVLAGLFSWINVAKQIVDDPVPTEEHLAAFIDWAAFRYDLTLDETDATALLVNSIITVDGRTFMVAHTKAGAIIWDTDAAAELAQLEPIPA
ncbi:hypothetical protein [Leifsonia sp. Leaf264]|uniref:hypothetical protein n=1 Tax=Leifsonia sp. Leaf264 TaxID=1736314 RepID=UPI0006F9E9AB|nr:hypothetical protein [Leifsonia sp. Leaf264]KQO98529.1 hypothetical protein ASF30_10735 [Leifsonia sp. Leaf264]